MTQKPTLVLSRAIRLLAIVVLVVSVFAPTARAATVRGRLDRVYPNGARSPAAGVAVTVFSQVLGRSNPSYAGADGFYYLNVQAGSYYLEVWTSRDPRVQPTVYPITIVEPHTDIPPIVVQ